MCAVPDLLAEALATLHFEGDHLVPLYVTEDFGFDGGLYGAAYAQFTVQVDQKDFRELNFIANIPSQLRYVQALVLLYLKLLAGYFNNCKHNCPKLGVQK